MAGRLVGIVGPSGIGKTTIISELVDTKKKFARGLFYTTRSPRWYERNGRDYQFVARAELEALMASDNSVKESSIEIDGELYTISHRQIQSTVDAGRIVLLELFIGRVPEFRAKYSDRFRSLFLAPPNLEVLGERLRQGRVHDEAFVKRRLEQAQAELALVAGEFSRYFDRVIEMSGDLQADYEAVEASALACP
jgi:guanylate kinase